MGVLVGVLMAVVIIESGREEMMLVLGMVMVNILTCRVHSYVNIVREEKMLQHKAINKANRKTFWPRIPTFIDLSTSQDLTLH